MRSWMIAVVWVYIILRYVIFEAVIAIKRGFVILENNVLIKIFKIYPNSWKDIRRFKALLGDFLPEDKLRRNSFFLQGVGK